MATSDTERRVKMEGKTHSRRELGAALPDGWVIYEHEGWYLPCFGDTVTLTPRRTLRAACDEISVFCVMGLARGVSALGQMVIAQRDMFEDEVKGGS